MCKEDVEIAEDSLYEQRVEELKEISKSILMLIKEGMLSPDDEKRLELLTKREASLQEYVKKFMIVNFDYGDEDDD
jgi:hypothetical protein